MKPTIERKLLNELGKKGKPQGREFYMSWGSGMARMMYAVVLRRDSKSPFYVVNIEALRNWALSPWTILVYGKKNKDYKEFKSATAVINYLTKYAEKL